MRRMGKIAGSSALIAGSALLSALLASACQMQAGEDRDGYRVEIASPPSDTISGGMDFYAYSAFLMGPGFTTIDSVVADLVAEGARPVEAWFDDGNACSGFVEDIPTYKTFLIRFHVNPNGLPHGFAPSVEGSPFSACGGKARMKHYLFP